MARVTTEATNRPNGTKTQSPIEKLIRNRYDSISVGLHE